MIEYQTNNDGQKEQGETMSVTIKVEGNEAYCQAAGLVVIEKYDCQSCAFDGKINPACTECSGKGFFTFPQYPWELNVSNQNFHTLWSSLALPLDPDQGLCGTVDPITVIEALRCGDPALAVRAGASVKLGKREGALLMEFGIDHDKAEYYHLQLWKMAKEAIKRGKHLTFA
jgi:hypothetical protein